MYMGIIDFNKYTLPHKFIIPRKITQIFISVQKYRVNSFILSFESFWEAGSWKKSDRRCMLRILFYFQPKIEAVILCVRCLPVNNFKNVKVCCFHTKIDELQMLDSTFFESGYQMVCWDLRLFFCNYSHRLVPNRFKWTF